MQPGRKLGDDIDHKFILNGIKSRFDIIDKDSCVHLVTCKKHPSARPSSSLYDKATSQVIKEIQNGHYVVCDTPTRIISLMAAIPKPDGDVQLIYDCSRLVG